MLYDTITSVEEFKAFGFNFSDEITDEKIHRSLYNAEQFIIKPNIPNDLFKNLFNGDKYLYLGGFYGDEDVYIQGLRYTIFNFAFAFLIRDDINSTTFGSVKKKDDYSTPISFEDVRSYTQFYATLGYNALDEVLKFLKLKPANTNYFFEI